MIPKFIRPLVPVEIADIRWWLISVPVWLALSAILAIAIHVLRPDSARLPWVSDWAHHIETKAQEAGVNTIQLPGVRNALEEPDWIIFDARTAQQYENGHIPGAYSLPIGEVNTALLNYMEFMDADTPIIVYCDGEECADSLELAIQLQSFGFTNLVLYPGGYAQWVEYGGDILHGTGFAP